MIISDTYRFVFVHIPKCAGSTIRHALAPYDEHADLYYHKAVSKHPALGLLDYPHIPLAVLKEHFPEDFTKLTTYRSFALIRDPFSRFPSSLHERLVQRDGRPLAVRAPTEIAHEIDAVMARLANHDKEKPIIDPALIHFSRQYDYVAIDGKQTLSDLRTVAEVGALLADISKIIGKPVHIKENRNRRFHHVNPTVARLQRAAVWPIEKILPRSIWKPAYEPIKKAFWAIGLAQKNDDLIARLPNAADINAFIAEFYARDIALIKRLEAERL